jgi:hypothetical protein
VDGILSRQGEFPSERDVKRELARGVKQGDSRHDILLLTCIHVYNAQLSVECNLIIVRGIIIA